MEDVTIIPDQRVGEPTLRASGSEWHSVNLRPVAHWVLMPTADGRSRLSMVWETPAPLPGASA